MKCSVSDHHVSDLRSGISARKPYMDQVLRSRGDQVLSLRCDSRRTHFPLYKSDRGVMLHDVHLAAHMIGRGSRVFGKHRVVQAVCEKVYSLWKNRSQFI